jgi:transcriptional regulator with XRE-family HTH domain
MAHERLSKVGEFIKAQRRLADLSLRQLADLAKVSNPYLSQVERGLHNPSAEVLKSIAKALGISSEVLFTQAGLLDPKGDDRPNRVEDAIKLDPYLSTEKKETLIRVYRDLAGLETGA